MNNDRPEGWTTVRVKDAFRSFGGGTPSRARPAYWGGDVPWLSSGDIKSERVRAGSETVTPAGVQHSSASLCRPGSVLVVVRSGILKHTLPIAVLEQEAAINQDIKCFDSGDDDLNRWLALGLRASAKAILAQNRDGTTVQSVKYDTLLNLELPVPPPAEQRGIVAKLEELLSRVSECDQRLLRIPGLLRRFRQSVLAAACSGRLTADWRQTNHGDGGTLLAQLGEDRRACWEQWESALSIVRRGRKRVASGQPRYGLPLTPDRRVERRIPPTWRPVTISHVAFLDTGPAFKSSAFTNIGIRLLRGENVEPGKLRWESTRYWPTEELDRLAHLLVQDGEIILALDRPLISGGLKIARAAKADVPCLLVQRVMRFRMVDSRLTSWLFHNLSTGDFIRHISSGLTGSDLPHVTGSSVAEYTFGLPPLNEQLEIARRIEALFALADQIDVCLTGAREHINRISPAVLEKAFSGGLVGA